jgi:hypothetical protein
VASPGDRVARVAVDYVSYICLRASPDNVVCILHSAPEKCLKARPKLETVELLQLDKQDQ